MTKVYLKEGVILEPLFCQWFAWPFLISPSTAAIYLRKHYLPMVESFIEEPELHLNAVRNPAMRAGSFLNHSGELKLMADFLIYAETALVHLLELSDAIDKTNKMLIALKGYTSKDIYAQLPVALKGIVELVYDLNHSPAIRFIEPLLYSSRFFDPSLQSLRFRSIVEHDRIFTLNTPKFSDLGPIINVPFSSYFVDLIGDSRFKPIELEELLNEYPNNLSDCNRLKDLFTEEIPLKLQKRDGVCKDLRIRYFGHATILFEIGGFSILTDPCISPTMPESVKERLDYADLPDIIDLVLITHNHQDHVLLDTLLQLRSRIKKIIVPRNGGGFLQDPSLKLMLEAIGFKNVVEIGELEKIKFPTFDVIGIPFFGEHGELSIQSKIGYYITSPLLSVLLLADSDALDPELYSILNNQLGKVDVLFIGMDSVGAPYKWLYGPLYSEPLDHARGTNRRINGANCQRALEIVSRVQPKAAYIYAMGVEPWISHITGANTSSDSAQAIEALKFVRTCQSLGIVSELLYWSAEISPINQ
ncbi:MBL fold metallo-hydrolase [Acinetobacter pittii]|uniref:MBL fold metallo-hydrolase n=1 Tax=Acinetobacter pittii TaxID=48296 RepID=UPI0021CF1356|nr:MBL fold metallo-hydrolase [Acinetobacter pittii]MCU4528175.1 MBL fold metallo-hydrolase [Acinetobacter pittii]